jgi:cell division septation protein DedD
LSGWDFAQVETRSHEAPAPRTQGAKAILLVMASLMLLAGAFAFGFWFGHAQGKQTATGEERARLEKQLKQQQEELAQLRKSADREREAGVSTTQVGELTFYNELPRQAVLPAPLEPAARDEPARPVAAEKPSRPAASDSQAQISDILAAELQAKPVAAKTPTTPATADQGYLLQVGSFRQRADARRFADRFRPLGMTPAIRAAAIAERGTWYRVYVGPFATKAEAEGARSKVNSQLKIQGLIVKGG